MSKEKRRVPKLRFPGFTEDWEQRKLGDIATLSKGNGYSKSDLSASGNPIILYGRLYTNYETTIRNVDTFVKLKDKSVISQGGEVIVPASGETAEDISRASVVKNQGVIIGGDLNVIKVNILLDPTFLALTISNGEQQKELSKRAQGKSVVHLHNSDLQEVNLIFPLLNEQRKISTLFEKMDNIITLHQRKLNNLKLKKKALLQKLFPKNGERYPELRFPGFTDAWEQRKLSDILVERNEQQVETNEYPLMSFVQGHGVIPKGERYDRSFLVLDQSKKYKRTELGDFIYSSNNLETGSIGINKTGKAVISPVYSIFYGVSIGDSQFIGIMSLLPRFIAKMIRFRQGVVYGQWRIHEKDFLDISILIPSEAERTKITKLILSIEELITLHQRKLDHLQLQKKALLQQMFV
ncbi:restriction endonuclease subunit S [Veillonella parvula]|uniref:restriction endonuclease subunit S n=1 Tax=Veillonella parvula TaxID=29466 RepID=UPI00241F3319|nr:restriction endonuclease subunit S [Veillonella parvula]